MRTITLAFSVLALVITAGLLFAGPLNPPGGPVASTYKTLAEVEPRIAINATNTLGDADSVYRITQSGSYYLAGGVTTTSGKKCIEVAIDSVTIDLNGFQILGTANGLAGIGASSPTLERITIRNGSIVSCRTVH